MAVDFNQNAILARIRRSVMPEIVRATEQARQEAISLIQNGEKSGRIYKHRGIEHRASAPGEAPASDTGTLVNNIATSYDHNNLTGTLSVNVVYGLMLEFGTEKMEPRPFLRPAIASVTANLDLRIAGALNREFT